MTHIVDGLLSLQGVAVYAIVAALVFLESSALVGLVLPGETALLFGGVLASHGHTNLWLLIALAAAAAIAGDAVGYLIGRRVGPRLESSRLGRWVGEPRWVAAQDFVQSRGAWSVVAGRWVGVMRALVPPTAGLVGMPLRRFLAANVVGGIAWVMTVVLVGFAAGGSVTAAQSALGAVSLVTAVVIALLAGGALVRWRRARRGIGGAGQSARHTSLRWRPVEGPFLVASAAVATVALAVVVTLADAVTDGTGLVIQDPPVTAWVVAHRSPVFDALATVLTFSGSEVVVGGLTVLLLGFLWMRRKDRTAAALLAGAMAVSGALTLGLKAMFARPRPPVGVVLGSVDTSFSFPSGHTLNTGVFLGVVVIIALHRVGFGAWAPRAARETAGVAPGRSPRPVALAVALVSGAALVAVGVGASRVYLGYHWMTDVLASAALAVAIIAITAGISYRLLPDLSSSEEDGVVALDERCERVEQGTDNDVAVIGTR